MHLILVTRFVSACTRCTILYDVLQLMTALHWAAFHRRPEHVQLLVSKGANLMATDCDGQTALHWAARVRPDNHIHLFTCFKSKGRENRIQLKKVYAVIRL